MIFPLLDKRHNDRERHAASNTEDRHFSTTAFNYQNVNSEEIQIYDFKVRQTMAFNQSLQRYSNFMHQPGLFKIPV